VERFGPTRRGGPVFRWLGEPLAIDLANTVMVVRDGEAVDLLAGQEELRRWLEVEEPRLGECAFAVGHLDELRVLRDAVRRLLGARARRAALPRADLDLVNATSAAAPIAPWLHAEDGGRVEVVEHAGRADALAQLRGRLARSTIAVLGGADADRLRVCRAPSCGMFFLGERRWCCGACGNRARAARHYERTRARD
jgi:predicted RNA-binding Zn ribbon-like protein